MTIVYGDTFLKALFRWNGSVYKSIWKETLVWLLLYYMVKIIFLFLIPSHPTMKELVKEFYEYTKNFPVEFLLGFYVKEIVNRWWNQVMLISSPHEVMATIVAYIYEQDPESQRTRHTIARYLVLYYSLAYRNISTKLQRLFPMNESYIDIGLLTVEENDILLKVPKRTAHEIVYQWVIELIRENAGNHNVILNALNTHRANMKQLFKYNDIALPLVYTQTVTIAVYGYFVFALIGHQFYRGEQVSPNYDIYVPVFTLLRFTFNVGWLKVAEYLSKPFGEDDDDIDLCKYLASFCDNVFTIANYTVNHKPLKSLAKDESQAERIKIAFDDGITRFERMGSIITNNLKKAVACGNV